MQFTPLVDFFSPELKSQYVAGLRYTVRAGDDLLRRCAARWLAEGKIKALNATDARVSGAGS